MTKNINSKMLMKGAIPRRENKNKLATGDRKCNVSSASTPEEKRK